MSVFSQALLPVRKVINDLFADDFLATEITYRSYSGQSFDSIARVTVTSFTEKSITVVRLRHTDESARVGASQIQAGDQLYLFRYDDCPAKMSLKDEIEDEYGKIQMIKDINNIFKLAVAVTVEGGTSAIGA